MKSIVYRRKIEVLWRRSINDSTSQQFVVDSRKTEVFAERPVNVLTYQEGEVLGFE